MPVNFARWRPAPGIRTRIAVYTATLVFFSLGIYLTVRADRTLSVRLREVQSQLADLEVVPLPSVLDPALDAKLKILRKNPGIGVEAKTLLASRELRAPTDREFHVLFAFYFLTENHIALADLVRNTSDATSAVDHIDFAYLLPAVLFERQGLLELARINYLRYLTLIRDLSLRHDLAGDRFFQDRLSFARLKKEFLDRELPGVRSDYYSASYFSALANGFFEINFTDVDYFQKYWGLIDPYGMYFESEALCQLVSKSTPQADPFSFYEVCISSSDFPPEEDVVKGDLYTENVDAAPEEIGFKSSCSCELGRLTQVLPKGDFLRSVSLYAAALRAFQRGNHGQARTYFEAFDVESIESTEFLRDDALFFKAMMLFEEGRRAESIEAMQRLARGKSSFDYSRRAEYVLQSWAEQSDP